MYVQSLSIYSGYRSGIRNTPLIYHMTSNTKWPKITTEKEEGQNPYNRPDIICQVFEGK